MALIMLADDEPDIVAMLKDLLTMRGHQVVSVPDGVQMIEKAKDWRPHLIIADLMMPGAYGSAAYKALAEDSATASIPVIFLTAVAPDTAQRVVPESPRVRLMHKPVEIKALLATIEELTKPPAA